MVSPTPLPPAGPRSATADPAAAHFPHDGALTAWAAFLDTKIEEIKEQMQREEATRPLVGMQRLCWVAAYQNRLGESSPAKFLPLELIESIAQR